MSMHIHLTLSERIQIELGLNQNESFKSIARSLNRDCTTISKEVKLHHISKKSGGNYLNFNDCIHAYLHTCKKKYVCAVEDCISRNRNRPCWSCGACRKICLDYKIYTCPKLNKAPYVCNGCQDRLKCHLEKQLYSAQAAYSAYKENLSISRIGISISSEELQLLDDLISPRLKQGQSLHHICTTIANELTKSETTLYTYVNAGLFTARNINMPKVVRMKPRKQPGPIRKIDRNCRQGRTYQDYLHFIEMHPDVPTVQLDTVEGVRGGAVLLTVHFVEASFQLAFILQNKTAQAVIDQFSKLYNLLGGEKYNILFPLLLADNGSEFSNPEAIEQLNQCSRLFYCDAGKPYQKGSCENNHTLIRRCIPKGTPLHLYTQDDINLIMSHINSYTRSKLGNKSALDVFTFLYGDEIPAVLGIKPIAPGDIVLTPKIINK